MTCLVMIPFTVLLFLSLEFAEEKSYNKPTSILLLLIFGIFHTTSRSVPCWDEAGSWEVLDFNPKSDSAFPVPDQAAAVVPASNVSSPKTNLPPPTTSNTKPKKSLMET